MLKRIKEMADGSGLEMVAYISMAFGNPYGDLWSEEKVVGEARTTFSMGISAISLADTVGAAEPERIHRVVAEVLRDCPECEIGIHMHSTRAAAGTKVLAAFEAVCRRFDSAIGGLGGCPFAQDMLVGNIPTEDVVSVLEQRGLRLPIRDSLAPRHGDESRDQRRILGCRCCRSLDLHNARVESCFRHRTRNILQQAGEDLARFVWLNDGIYPAARGAVTNIGLLFVIFLHCRAQFFELFRR